MELYNSTNDKVKLTLKQKKEDEHDVLDVLNDLLSNKNAKLDRLTSREEETNKSIADLEENISLMSKHSDQELFDIRRRIKMHFQNIIDKIEIFPIGLPWDNTLYIFKALIPKTIGKLYDITEDDIKIMTKENRRYVVHFKEGGCVSAKYDIENEKYTRISEIDDINDMMFTVGKIKPIKLS
jgi:hypothetical protein